MPKPKTNNTYIHCRVSQTTAAALKKAAADDDRSDSWIIRKALEEFLQARGYDTAPL
jgi:predicted transcriptional regulator